MLIPPVGKQVTACKTLWQIVIVKHRQSVPHAVHALKPDPSIRFAPAKGCAERVCIRRAKAVETGEPRLYHSMIATRLKRLRALSECFRDVVLSSSRCYSDRMRVYMTRAPDFSIGAQAVERAHRNLDEAL